MKYRVLISGGFGGIIRKYSGDVTVSESTEDFILSEKENLTKSSNPNLRDALDYELNVTIKDEEICLVYNDTTLPEKLENFIDQVTASKKHV